MAGMSKVITGYMFGFTILSQWQLTHGRVVESCSSTYTSNNGLECMQCPVGTFLKNKCTINYGKSDCHDCPTGQYQQSCSEAISCAPCSPCSRHGAIEQSPCTARQDTTCVCPPGTFYQRHSSVEGLCITHTTCGVGEGVVETGSAVKDTDCGECDPGTYSDTDSYNPCQPCRLCDAYISQCTRKTDARCENVTSQTLGDVTDKSGSSPAMSIGIVLTCLAVIIAVVVVICCLRKKKLLCWSVDNNQETRHYELVPQMNERCNGDLENGQTPLPKSARNGYQIETAPSTNTRSVNADYTDADVQENADHNARRIHKENGRNICVENGQPPVPNAAPVAVENGHPPVPNADPVAVENGHPPVPNADPAAVENGHLPYHEGVPSVTCCALQNGGPSYPQGVLNVTHGDDANRQPPVHQAVANTTHSAVGNGQSPYPQIVPCVTHGVDENENVPYIKHKVRRVADQQSQHVSSRATGGATGSNLTGGVAASTTISPLNSRVPTTQSTIRHHQEGLTTVRDISTFLKSMISYAQFIMLLPHCPGTTHSEVDAWISNAKADYKAEGCEEQMHQLLKRYCQLCPDNICDNLCQAMRKCGYNQLCQTFQAWWTNRIGDSHTSVERTVTNDSNVDSQTQETELSRTLQNDQIRNNDSPTRHQESITGENNGPHAQETEALHDFLNSHLQHNESNSIGITVASDDNSLAQPSHEANEPHLWRNSQQSNANDSSSPQPANNTTPHAQETKASYINAVAATARVNNQGVTCVHDTETLHSTGTSDDVQD